MSVLVFPNNPVDGEVYPPELIPGVNQYFWDSATETWIQLPACPMPEGVTLVDTGAGLTGGPITYQGIIEIAETGVTPGSYTNANITVNAQGQITEAESGLSPQGVTEVDTGTGLTGGPITDTGTISLADTTVAPGSYTNANITVNAQGQITEADNGDPGILPSIIADKGDIIVGQSANTPVRLPVGTNGKVLVADSAEPLGVKWAEVSSGSGSISSTSFVTDTLVSGSTQEFWLDLGNLVSLVSLAVTGSPEDVWLRVYTTEAGMLDDTRVSPGPPFPSPNSGFAVEVVTNSLEPSVNFVPVPVLYSQNGFFFKVTNLSANTQSFTIDLNYQTSITTPCNYPPYGSSIYINTSCITYFSVPSGELFGSTPSLAYSGGTTLIAQAYNSYTGAVSGGSGGLGQFSLTRGGAGEITSLNLFSGSGYQVGDTVTILGSLIGGTNGADSVTITLSRTNGMMLVGAWEGEPSISTFPFVNVNNGLDFYRAWKDCTSLVNFPAHLFDNCAAVNFSESWVNCALSQQSVDNILVSLDSAGQSNGVVDITGGTSSAPGMAGSAAKVSLESKGWIVNVNVNYIYCTPDYPLLPVTYPPYGCNTSVNTAGVTDFTAAWDSCPLITTFPCVDSSSVTLFSAAWRNCHYMTTFPSIDTSQGTDFNYTWAYCYTLNNFPTLNFLSGASFTYSWGYCYGLTDFPACDLSSGSNFYGTWNACTNLGNFPPLDLSSGTDFTFAWYNCSSLTSFPLIDVSSGTNFHGSWWQCSGLTSFPALNASLGTDFSNSWSDCSGLTSFPSGIVLSAGTNFDHSWYYCNSLTSFPSLNLSSGLSFFETWAYCTSMTSFGNVNLSSGTNFQGAWGFCSGLTSFPTLNVSSGTNFQAAWQGCYGLTSFPTLNVGLGTDFTGSWQGCYGLTSFPLLSFGSATLFYRTWYNCSSLASFPANAFDSCLATNFTEAWYNCALDQTSVDNILVSLDTAGQSNGTVNLNAGTSSAPGPAGVAAKLSLQGKGWTVTTN